MYFFQGFPVRSQNLKLSEFSARNMKKCPYFKTNLPLFYEYIKRRLDFKGRHLKTQPVRVDGAQRNQFMNSLHDDDDE